MSAGHWGIVGGLALVVLGFGSPSWAGTSAYEKALKQEMALLQTEVALLQQQLERQAQQAQETQKSLRADIAERSALLSKRRLRAEALEQRALRAKELQAARGDPQDELDALWRRAATTLEQLGLSPAGGSAAAPATATGAQMATAFAAAVREVGRLGGVHVEPTRYFTGTGEERQGEVLWVSQVAAIAHADGPLAPTAAGTLKVVGAPGAAPAQQGSVALVDAYVFDPLAKGGQTVARARTPWETFVAGGYLMWPILVLGLLALFVLVERVVVLRVAHTNADRLMAKVRCSMAAGAWDQASAFCRVRPGAVAKVLHTILRHRGLPRPQLEDLVHETLLAQRPSLERFLPALQVIAAVTPLLGLLGTVTGMIATFMVITEFGTGDPRLLSGGISEALLTTQFGLAVAVPTLLAHAILAGQVDHVLSDMEINAVRLLNDLHSARLDPAPWALPGDDDDAATQGSLPPPGEQQVRVAPGSGQLSGASGG